MLDRRWLQNSTAYIGLLVALVALVAIFGASSRYFLQWATLRSIANQIPELTLVSVGMTFILVIRGIDLSVGSLLALAAAIIGVTVVQYDWPIPLALLAACLATAVCGAVSGAIATSWRIPSFIVTLGMLEIARGGTKWITDSKSIYIGGRIEWFGESVGILGISPAFMVAICVVAFGQFLLTQTVMGRYCVAMGTNPAAVHMSGIRIWPYTIAVFALSGFLCGLAAWAQLGRMPTSDPNTAVGIELSAIAACVIGGTSLMGGRGTVVGTFLGVLIIQVLQTGLAQIGVTDSNKQIITGVVIILAVGIDALRARFGQLDS